MLIYILKSAACLAILLLFYKLFLEKENMHVFKRFYLLGSLLFALIVPTIVFSEYVVVEPQVYETPTQSSEIVVVEPNIPPALEADVIDIAPLLWIVYFLGMFFFGIKFLRNLFQIFLRIRRNPKYKNSSFIQVMLQEKIPPHTFFKYIFLNQSKFESKEIPKEVILHEETHARQKHSLDVVFIELLQVIFWVNPLIYFFKKAIKLNHEFLADSAVLNKDVDAVTYQNTLLSFLSSESAKKYQPTLPNAINYSSIKKRFTIMKSKTSKKSIVLRSFLLLPLLALLLAGFTETKLVKVAPEVEMHLEEISLPNEIIQISVNGKGQVLIDNSLVEMEDLDSFIRKLNQNLLKEKATKIERAKIIVNHNSPISIIADVERILGKHSIDQIDVLGSEIISPVQSGATKVQLSKYNSLAKKYNAVPKKDRAIPLGDLKILEQVFKEMTDSQKTDAQPFPECQQDGATKEQVAEYNAMAKKYNRMINAEENIWIKKGEVERLEYLHSLMSEEQRENAEPFPDFPEPPPPPNAPDEIEEEMLKIEHDIVRREAEMEKQEHEMERREVEMEKQEMEMEVQERAMEKQEVEMERLERYSHLPAAPNLEYRTDQKPLTKELKKLVNNFGKKRKLYQNAVKDYLNNGRGNVNEIYDMHENLMEAYDEYKLMATDEGVFANPVPAFAPRVKKGQKSDIPPPPPPPSPKSPLDHVIEMAKQGATFYYEDKEVTSDEAIKILKKNKSINIDSRKDKGKRPVVKLSTKPIKIGSTYNISKKPNRKLEKVALVSLQSNETIAAEKIITRLREFSNTYRNCKEYYFDGRPISENKALKIYINEPEIEVSSDNISIARLVVKC